MKVTFYGAAGEVTGSQHLVDCGGSKVLLDCGLFQGSREETYRKNRHPNYDPSQLHAAILSHAHLDHSGLFPRIAGIGFDGSIHCTTLTAELCDPMLRDSAFVQQKDIEFVNKIHRRKGLPPFNVLYGDAEVEKTLSQLRQHDLHVPFEAAPGISASLIDAGHVLGSAQVLLELQERGRRLRLGFTGDLGRRDLPLLKDPERLTDLDALIIESTYGNRDHDPINETGPELREVIQSTYAKRGKVIIPAFALERTQELLFLLAEMYASGDLPHDMPVYVDSPLATKCTEIFGKHLHVYDKETKTLLRDGINPFDFPGLHYTESVEDSKALNIVGQPMIIIAASGMMEAGRILHHLANNIEDSRNTILIVSYQAEHTLGRRIAERHKDVRIFGDIYPLRARVKILNTFSGHAGRSDLLTYARAIVDNSPRLKKVFVVHGEESQAQSLIKEFETWNSFECVYPQRGQTFTL